MSTGFGIAFFATLFISLILHCHGKEHHVIFDEEELEIERQLKIINKPALKTIQTEYGEIIDCVDINKQPALDHPQLKNHKIQRRPSFALPVVKKEGPSLAKPAKVSESNGCPTGSVPIPRTTKADIIRSMFSIPANINDPAGTPSAHFSYISLMQPPSGIFSGAKAYIDIYNPKVEDGQSSAAQIWIEGGPISQVNSIQVGWVVDPTTYGDHHTHLSTYWTGDGYKSTGCYDIRCPGFVQIDEKISLGLALSNTSTINGDQYTMLASVYQDKKTGNWWFVYTDNNIQVGYWPKELFPHLAGGATTVFYGGRAQGVVNHLSPPMGSGLKPDNSRHKFNHACFFSEIQFLDRNDQITYPSEYGARGVNDNSGCYGLDNHGWDKNLGYTFLFGGPGGQCGN